MKLKEIHRTATFAWSPTPSVPLIATGTVAGALDESFSNAGQLEIWAPDFVDNAEYDIGGQEQVGPKGSVTTNSRFNRIAWGYPNTTRPRGVIAAGMENGELGLWDPEKILATSDATESLIFRNTTHQGSVRGLDFNPIQTNLFASGAINGEIYIWDLKDPSKPYSPGSRSSKLDEITALAWNRQVQYVLASASSTGYTVVWDLRGKREVVALTYGGGGATFGGPQGGRSMSGGGRRGMSDVAWHPENATRVVTSSEDDSTPIVMVWDLRNTRAPEKILTGHEKGVLSLSWCQQDADLLLSCGKDNRALCWNPQTSEIIGELPSAENWAFQVQWCPRNPDLLATAYFDGTIGIHSLQSTNESTEATSAPAPQADGSDVFDVPGFARSSQATLSLKQPPKWLRRPVGASFGYGGNLVTVSNLPNAQGKNQSSVVHVRKVVGEPDIVQRVKRLEAAEGEGEGGDGEGRKALMRKFAEERSKEGKGESASWKALLSLFRADSREELVVLLGFSKEEIVARVEEAVEKIKASAPASGGVGSAADTQHHYELGDNDEEFGSGKPHEPVVSFLEPEREEHDHEQDGEGLYDDLEGNQSEPTPSEQSAGATSDVSDLTKLADGESTTTAPSLFGDDIGGLGIGGAPHTPGDAAADFFSAMGAGTVGAERSERVQVPHVNYAHDSSVAATVGSRPSSAASEVRGSPATFRIHPADESDVERLVTRALVLGDFESAVTLCLSAERYADAILLSVKGGPELLARTQKAYFEKRTTALPYLRVFQSVVTNDLADIVQNADLQEWREIFVVLCTFAKADEFSGLVEQLGQRLEFHGNISKGAERDGAEEFRKHATLTYLAAGRLEKVVNIWMEEMGEEESLAREAEDMKSNSEYSTHAHALQTFMEKVTVFRSATNYVDTDLSSGGAGKAAAETEGIVRSYKLAGLYDRYIEYADLLAAQGLIPEAVKFLKLTPADYRSSDLDAPISRERLLAAAGEKATTTTAGSARPAVAAQPAVKASAPAPAASYGYSAAPAAPQTSTIYGAYNPNGIAAPAQTSAYAPALTQTYQPTAPMQPYGGTAYAPSAPAYSQAQTSAPSQFGAPPAQAAPPPPPPPKKQENGGWNDAPAVVPERRTPITVPGSKVAAITSPFPNATPMTPTMSSVPGLPGQGPSVLPPPPRPGSVARGSPQPIHGPPHGRPQGLQGPYPPGPGRALSPPQVQQQPPPPPPGRYAAPPISGQGPPQFGGAPGRALSPPQGGLRQSSPSQYTRGPGGPAMGPTSGPYPPGPGPYTRATPQPGPDQRNVPPPPPQQGGGPYAASAIQQRPPPPPSSFGPGPQQMRDVPPPPQGPGQYASSGMGSQLRDGPPQQPQDGGRYGPPQGSGMGPGGGLQPQGGPRDQGPTSSATAPAPPPPAPKGPPPPKYPPGDRSHIPENSQRAYGILAQELIRLKQTTPPQQKRMVDDTERRLNALFDALNCETLSPSVVDQLIELTEAMAARDQQRALALHVDLLTNGSRTDDVGLWASGVKLLILRM
ncbi:hypothetical protein BD410DRAFT_276586 [Rickenella mellea]|uniref:Protein transport protein SEC31 n=1 Tax=Rickenella mellea TaxID=50990 RepID=A0A4Y7Q3R2_9AGAM|nr:hypothetical protein BD410DRAFT_276586 [Rickenella mellea]